MLIPCCLYRVLPVTVRNSGRIKTAEVSAVNGSLRYYGLFYKGYSFFFSAFASAIICSAT
jgi:hypothetical protein